MSDRPYIQCEINNDSNGELRVADGNPIETGVMTDTIAEVSIWQRAPPTVRLMVSIDQGGSAGPINVIVA
ncbi:hypothetical protein BST61_g1248 [Cercospora zeina]